MVFYCDGWSFLFSVCRATDTLIPAYYSRLEVQPRPAWPRASVVLGPFGGPNTVCLIMRFRMNYLVTLFSCFQSVGVVALFQAVAVFVCVSVAAQLQYYARNIRPSPFR